MHVGHVRRTASVADRPQPRAMTDCRSAARQGRLSGVPQSGAPLYDLGFTWRFFDAGRIQGAFIFSLTIYLSVDNMRDMEAAVR
jgi:hypothetical protein